MPIREAADLAIGLATLAGLSIVNVGLILWEGLRSDGRPGLWASGGHGTLGAAKLARENERRMTKMRH